MWPEGRIEGGGKVESIQETTKTGGSNMSSVEKITELAKVNFEPDGFIINLSYLGTQAITEFIQ